MKYLDFSKENYIEIKLNDKTLNLFNHCKHNKSKGYLIIDDFKKTYVLQIDTDGVKVVECLNVFEVIRFITLLKENFINVPMYVTETKLYDGANTWDGNKIKKRLTINKKNLDNK